MLLSGVDWGFGYGGTQGRQRAGYTKTAISLPQGHAGTGGRRTKTRWLVSAATNRGHADMGRSLPDVGVQLFEVDCSDLVVKETGGL